MMLTNPAHTSHVIAWVVHPQWFEEMIPNDSLRSSRASSLPNQGRTSRLPRKYNVINNSKRTICYYNIVLLKPQDPSKKILELFANNSKIVGTGYLQAQGR